MGKKIIILRNEEDTSNNEVQNESKDSYSKGSTSNVKVKKSPIIKEDNIKDHIKKCNLCFGFIKPTLPTVECACGNLYHESCGGRIGKCPVCKMRLKLGDIGKLIRKGVILRKKGLFKEALIQYDKALQLSTVDDETIYFNKGYALASMKMIDDAVKCYEKSIQIEKEYYRAYNNLGVIFMRKKEYDKANGFFNKGKKINQDSDKIFFNMGYYFYKKRDYRKAIEYFNDTLNKNKTHFKSLTFLSICFLELKENEKAMKAIKKSLTYNNTFYLSHYVYGKIKMEKGEYEKARESFERSITLNRKHVNSFFYHIICSKTMNDDITADNMKSKLRKIYPTGVLWNRIDI